MLLDLPMMSCHPKEAIAALGTLRVLPPLARLSPGRGAREQRGTHAAVTMPGAPGRALPLGVPAPPQFGAWPPCPRTTWAAAREGSVAACGCGKPITFPRAVLGEACSPARALRLCSTATRHNWASRTARSQAWAEPCAGCVCRRVRVPAAVGEPGTFTWRCPCGRGRWAAAPREGAAVLPVPAAPSAEGE